MDRKWIRPGSRVTVQWSDGRSYSAMVQSLNNGWYGVRFDGQANIEWLPPHAVHHDFGPQPNMAACADMGFPCYEDGSTVMATFNGVYQEISIGEFEPPLRGYSVSFAKDPIIGNAYVDPWAIDPRTHFGLYGRAGQAERNNPTVPVGTHVTARSRNGRIAGGEIVLNDGERLVIRWDGMRAREYIVKEQILQMGGTSAPPPPRPGEFGLFAAAGMMSQRLPPTEDQKEWYRDGETVWAQWHEDQWWYEAVVVSREWKTPAGQRGYSMYTIEWADGFGRTFLRDAHLRFRRPGLF
jgi:hypothetical protein